MKLSVSVYDSTGALIGGELEAKSKKKNKPLWARSDVEDLIRRLIGKTKDEGTGHPFHGNQYVEVAGQKVSVPTKGSVKEKLHNLFAQGHKFTLKELAALLGQSEVTLRGRLSEIKKAAPAGGLILEKNGEHYSIKKKEVDPGVSAYLKQLEDDAEKEALAHKAAEAKANGEAPTPSPEPVAPAPEPEKAPETSMSLAEKTLPEVGTFDPPATGPMPKPEADKIYADKLKDWADAVQGAKLGEDGEVDADAADALAQGWKNTKANAMAEWKSNTSGVAVIAQPQPVFEADKQIVKDVIAGDSIETALAKWKTNTQNEKKGTWPPDPLAEEKKAAAAQMAALAQKKAAEAAHLAGEEYKKQQVAALAAKEAAMADAYKEHGPHFATVPNYVSHDHAGITADDVLDESFTTGIQSVQAKLFNDSKGDQGNKIEVQHAIEARLTSSKAFQSLVAQRGGVGAFGGSLAAQLVGCWAGSSGGQNPVSNAMQITIRDAFEMKQADVAYDALQVLKGQGGNEEMTYHKAAQSLQCKYDTPEQKATFRSGLRDFALAQYHNTQDVFKKRGVDHVFVARGSGGNIGVMKDDAATHGTIKLQPASSFSTNMGTAHGFSGGDSVYMVKVPVSQVLGSARSGYGCTGEYELVVLAHPKMAAIRIPASKGYNLDQAVEHVKATIKTGPSASAEALAKYEASKAIKQASAELKLKVQAKVGSAPPEVPKSYNHQLKPVYKAAKYGKVAEAEAMLEAYKKGTYVYAGTQAGFEKYVEYAKAVAAHKNTLLIAKAQVKAEEKAAAKANKPKKPTVHVHIHNEQPKLPPHLQSLAAKMEAAHSHTVTEVTPAGYGPETAFDPESGKKMSVEFNEPKKHVPEWYAKHPMHNEAKYHEMVAKGKTPIQIKHYYGSLKHAAIKKLPGAHA